MCPFMSHAIDLQLYESGVWLYSTNTFLYLNDYNYAIEYQHYGTNNYNLALRHVLQHTAQ